MFAGGDTAANGVIPLLLLSLRWENAQYHQNAPVSSISRHAFILQITYALDNAGQHNKIADTLNYTDEDQEAQ